MEGEQAKSIMEFKSPSGSKDNIRGHAEPRFSVSAVPAMAPQSGPPRLNFISP